MIRIVDAPLDADTVRRLDALQAEVDGAGAYPAQVSAAQTLFTTRSRDGRKPFTQVRENLRRMCSGNERCMYCEDSPANEVEHFRPKDLYPERVFRWENLLLACGMCNAPKSNRFKLFSPSGASTVIEGARRRGSPIAPPPDGDPLLIDPRADDPLAFLTLDLRDTFHLSPRPALAPRDKQRAEYTISLLGLNKPMLTRGRRGARAHFERLLRCYIEDRDREPSDDDVHDGARGVREINHATVWVEMKRQRDAHPRLAALFAAAPEALDW